MAKLRDSLQPIPFSVVPPVAFRVVLGVRGFLKDHLLKSVVLFAVYALSPTSVAASIVGSLPRFDQEVVSTIGAQDEVRRAVVSPDVIQVVDFLFALHVATECPFDHELVLKDVPARVGIWMSGGAFQNVAIALECPALPVGIFFERHSGSVTFANQQRLALTNAVASAIPGPTREGSGEPASTPTNTRRIYQTALLKVRAETATNLTL